MTQSIQKKIIVITPVKHINGFVKKISKLGIVVYKENISYDQLCNIISKFDIIFTNPNKSKIYFDENILKKAVKLKILCTASTGTNHIDIKILRKLNIKLISLTKNKKIINQISSTAEHALALTLSAMRKLPFSHQGVLKGEWNYENYIGRQASSLTCGIIGFGRLGKFYYKFSKNLFKQIVIFDPYVKVKTSKFINKCNSLEELFKLCDIVSLHVHVNNETENLIDKKILSVAKNDLILINTSRGEIVNNSHLIQFLKKNKNAIYATDVLSNEIQEKKDNIVLNYLKKSDKQIIVTQHIGGMTLEGQQIAYNGVLESLSRNIN